MRQTNPSAETAPAILTVNVGAIVANYRSLRQRIGGTRCAAVVKADCYGLGAAEIAPALLAAGCSEFFVAQLSEGLELRDILGAGPTIYVLNGLPEGAETICAGADLIPVLNSLAQCRAWACMSTLPAVLQVDTGMSRLGLSVGEQDALLEDPVLVSRLSLVLLMSHLANADEPEHASNTAQFAAFAAARARFPALPSSLANSAGIFYEDSCHLDLCRPGAALYGIETGPRTSGIVPVVTLAARVTQLRAIAAGTSVGYGYQFTADRPMRLATIGVGYADGWLRALSGRGAAWFGAHRLPILGRVSMDSFIVDIDAVPQGELQPGDMVELIGPHQSADDVARMAGTIGYEVLTSLGARYHRIYQSGKGYPP